MGSTPVHECVPAQARAWWYNRNRIRSASGYYGMFGTTSVKSEAGPQHCRCHGAVEAEVQEVSNGDWDPLY